MNEIGNKTLSSAYETTGRKKRKMMKEKGIAENENVRKDFVFENCYRKIWKGSE